ncbi:hypothetical protein H310_13177 [Aphanomyces invadans]|uniref:Angiotensin-converting enzyme 2 n=1 Tax=Aphanomyces invadans TaxID=157072 RepID=A0A024TEN0_9STRA|nr:hypothetical protein H310_13177 [Aphanomyces invadans]ETV92488.1 hypothetical protein H310_13177 [Aphanomyces invadans]|eukprot:XP_008878795.1 hypothetical protein H310_13177 [Aphanomyces invadans]
MAEATSFAHSHGNPPSNNDDSALSWNEILRVQNLIERCLQQSMSKADIVHALQAQANVDPNFTRTVWQKLEEQNPSFFEAYTLHLTLKEQILTFNYLVNQQRENVAATPAATATSSSDRPQPSCPSNHQGQNNARGTSLSSHMAPMLSPIKTDLDTCAFFT